MSRDLLVRTALLAGAAFLTCMAGLLRYYVYPGALVLRLGLAEAARFNVALLIAALVPMLIVGYYILAPSAEAILEELLPRPTSTPPPLRSTRVCPW